MNNREFVEKALDLQLRWIAAADSRISLLLPLGTAMLTVLAALSPEASDWTVFPGIVATISVILLLGALMCAAVASFPRTEGPKSSLLFFGGIVTKTADKYLKSIAELSTDDIIDDLAHQCHRNAQIAHHKFFWVKAGMISLLSSIAPWLLTIYSLYTL